MTRLLMPEQGEPAVDSLHRFMAPPAFPIAPTELQGSWRFDSVDEGVHDIEDFEVTAREIPHKGGRTFGYRISDGRASVAYLSDHGPAGVFGAGPDGLGPYHQAALDLCAGVDLLIHDAQYTAEELPLRADYGHSAAEYPVELARRCGVGQVLLFHHDPSRTDSEVAELEQAFGGGDGAIVEAAREGVAVAVGMS
jgi:ribonuclease BN (tRNA processing enzyme)